MGHIGQSVLRVEDDRLLRGRGRFLSDLRIPGTLEAVFVRSTQAHADIRTLAVRQWKQSGRPGGWRQQLHRGSGEVPHRVEGLHQC